jgi:hypothetical protein
MAQQLWIWMPTGVRWMCESTGEQVTIALLAIALNKRGCPAVSMTGDLFVSTPIPPTVKARITQIDTEQVQAELGARAVVVIAGFQGRDEHNAITTPGRGGSDTTAVGLWRRPSRPMNARFYRCGWGLYHGSGASSPRHAASPPSPSRRCWRW